MISRNFVENKYRVKITETGNLLLILHFLKKISWKQPHHKRSSISNWFHKIYVFSMRWVSIENLRYRNFHTSKATIYLPHLIQTVFFSFQIIFLLLNLRWLTTTFLTFSRDSISLFLGRILQQFRVGFSEIWKILSQFTFSLQKRYQDQIELETRFDFEWHYFDQFQFLC